MPSPTLSVAVPVYQGARYLESSLRSVLQQSFRDFELVVVDDASNDGSQEIARRVARTRPDIDVRVLRNASRLGLVGNWNRCLEATRGKYVLLFHQDDLMEPGMLEWSIATLEEQPDLGFVYSTFSCINDDDQEVAAWSGSPFFGRIRSAPALEALLRENFICCPTVIVPRTVYDRVGPFDPRFVFSADLEMWLRIAARYDVFCCAERGVRYRLHQSQATQEFRTTRHARGEIEYLSAALVAVKGRREEYPELWRRIVRDNLWMLRQYMRRAPGESLWAMRILLSCGGDVLLAARDAILEKCGLRARTPRDWPSRL